tara:strand:+ start:113 stop:562 length:450 start_codon:yes stop_codon:yes gene_type:complete
MADLLSSTDKQFFVNVLGDIFDTFKREIVVHKEPKKKIINPAIELFAGYAESSRPDNIEYVHESKTFSALISYADSLSQQQNKSISEINSRIQKGTVRIKVTQEARDYIINGRTENVEVDGKKFNVITFDAVKYFFGLRWYVFYLEETL